jgi:predicted nucleotidyltransferase component of viral defense system
MLHLGTVEPFTLGLLRTLTQDPMLSDNFLVGGTSLSLQLGHRKSVDLDLFTHKPFDSVALLRHLQEHYPPVQELTVTNIIFISVVKGIKVDCVHFRYPFAFPLIEEEGMRLADMRDVASMKLDTVMKRGSRKDFYDMYYLFERYSPLEIIEWHKQMFKHETNFHVIRSLTYFEDAEIAEQPFVYDKKVTWEKVKKRMVEIVRTHF